MQFKLISLSSLLIFVSLMHSPRARAEDSSDQAWIKTRFSQAIKNMQAEPGRRSSIIEALAKQVSDRQVPKDSSTAAMKSAYIYIAYSSALEPLWTHAEKGTLVECGDIREEIVSQETGSRNEGAAFSKPVRDVLKLVDAICPLGTTQSTQ